MDQLKTYSYVGIATNKKGKRKIKYTNNKNRVVRLERDGFTNVIFLELPDKMNKSDALTYLKSQVSDPALV